MVVDPALQPHEPTCPPLSLSVEVSGDSAASDAALLALPAKPGVLVIEDENGGTLSLLQTRDLRRAARVRLGPIDPEQSRSRRADLRPLARRLLATTVGSEFEADWATLQLARIRLPHSYKSMLDRWQAWFVHCDPEQEFPQWTKTGHPTAGFAFHAGPFADKHAAARFREMLEDAFDLCRFHHILVQAPHGSACAYKEMGRCPAPCDGTVSMQHYHQQIRDSIEFAHDPARARRDFEVEMQQRGSALDFEGADRCKTLLDRTAIADRHEFAHVRDFAAFRFLAVAPAERAGIARVFAITGGWIAPVLDVLTMPDEPSLRAALQAFLEMSPQAPGCSETDIENIGLVCRHLLLPKAHAKRRRTTILPWRDDVPSTAELRRAIRIVQRTDVVPDEKPSEDHEIELG